MIDRICGSCRKHFKCKDVCDDGMKISSITNCYCRECYLSVFGKDRDWKILRRNCEKREKKTWRIA